jgi:uncharacterized membrane protein
VDAKPTDPQSASAALKPRELDFLRAPADAIKTRIISGLFLALPITITISIIYWLFTTLQAFLLDPIAHLVVLLIGNRAGAGGAPPLPYWWERYISPLIAIGLVLVLLYFLGYFARSRVARLLDWLMLRVPGVTVIYSAVRNVILSMETQRQSRMPYRMVLVPFPHPGMKALAMVTKELRDADTQKTILCVYVMTAVVPPAGFTLFVPEEEVVDVDWTTNETFQVILSGGMTAPGLIRYHTGGPTKLIVPGRVATEEGDLAPAPPEAVQG